MNEECILWTPFTKQVIGDKECNARKTQAFVLEGKTYSVSHLQFTLQIFQNTYSSFARLIIWVVWFLSILSCMSLLYMKPLQNMWFANVFFFIPLVVISFYGWLLLLCKRFWVWYGLTSLFLQFFPWLLMTELFELLVFWKAIFYQLLYLLLSSAILTITHRLAEWIWKQDPYICCL